jgi:hypothetical protein
MKRYDWSKGRRGFWAGKLKRGTMRNLDADLAELFPNDESVNAALRAMIAVAKVLPAKRKRKTAA